MDLRLYPFVSVIIPFFLYTSMTFTYNPIPGAASDESALAGVSVAPTDVLMLLQIFYNAGHYSAIFFAQETFENFNFVLSTFLAMR